MAVLGLRERKKVKTRDALVDSALRLFAERGFDRVTVDEVAAASDLSPRTFFRYFASKEDVLFADSDAHLAHVIGVLSEDFDDAPTLAALRGSMHEIVARYEREPDAVLLRHRIVADTPGLRGRVAERHHSWESAVIAELRRTGRAEKLGDLTLRLTVAAVTTALRVAIEVWIEGRCRGDLRSYFDTALRQLETGLDN